MKTEAESPNRLTWLRLSVIKVRIMKVKSISVATISSSTHSKEKCIVNFDVFENREYDLLMLQLECKLFDLKEKNVFRL